jgi:hypothetical protein
MTMPGTGLEPASRLLSQRRQTRQLPVILRQSSQHLALATVPKRPVATQYKPTKPATVAGPKGANDVKDRRARTRHGIKESEAPRRQ